MSILIEPAYYVGEFAPGDTIHFNFNVTDGTGDPDTLGGTPVVSVYKNSSTAESTAGVSLTVDFDTKTGLCHVAIDTSADNTFYAKFNDYSVIITTGTVNSISVVGTVVGNFNLVNRKSVLADDVAHGGTPDSSTATFAFSRMVGQSQTVDTAAFSMTGNGTGQGGLFQGGVTDGSGLRCLGGGSFGNGQDTWGAGVSEGSWAANGLGQGFIGAATGGSGAVIKAGINDGSNNSPGLVCQGGGSGAGVSASGGLTGDGMAVGGGNTSGSALKLIASGSDHDIALAGSGDILGNLAGTIDGLTAAGLATLFTVDSTKVHTDAIAGSPIKEITNSILNTIITEDYAAEGQSFNLAQALYEICQTLEERTIQDSILIIRKRDGSTLAFNLNLDSSTAPTSQTRITP